MRLGVVADDFTGATDAASMLVRAGVRTTQLIGVPEGPAPDSDAVVVALKSRTCAPEEAVRDALASCRWLRAAGARQIVFKICSTFDSTPRGNIGPVADALARELEAPLTVVCPALPENGRTVYQGHLFVHLQLLSESGMRQHPLTPMNDSNLVRVLQAQTPRRVGLLPRRQVAAGAQTLRIELERLRRDGIAHVVADAIDDQDLANLAEVCADLPLLVTGSGVPAALPAAWQRRGWLTPDANAARLSRRGGPGAIIAGSCSQATQAQVRRWRDDGRPAFRIDSLALAGGEPVVAAALRWARPLIGRQDLLVYATAAPDSVRAVHDRVGAEAASRLVEEALTQVACGLVETGVSRLVVAGGETSGAVVQALGIRRLAIGAPIEPGVPWTEAPAQRLLLALKSGNFGGEDFFLRALEASA